MLRPENFFNNENPIFEALFQDTEYVWEGLKHISEYISNNIKPNVSEISEHLPLVTQTVTLSNGAIIHAGACFLGDNIEIGPEAVIEPGAYIKEPAIIGAKTEVRQGAYLRGNVITGEKCVVGHTTEMKNSVMLGNSKAGHFAYIGDSILGAVNLGAGTKLANLKIVESEISVKIEEKIYSTGLRKFGAILGDGVETGCNSVTMPGTLLSKSVLLYPNTTARGYYPADTILKLRQNTQTGEKNNG
ncbi:glucose-1-phosphate thymidylyltransferase [Elusimicrobiota bacterium]